MSSAYYPATADPHFDLPSVGKPEEVRPLRSLAEIQEEKYAHCAHEMVRDQNDRLRHCRSRYICVKGCGLTQEF